MKIGFVGFEDIADIKIWAGIPHYIAKELKKANVEVIHISNINPSFFSLSIFFKRLLYNVILRRKFGTYVYSRDHKYLKETSSIIDKKIAEFNPDVILCCTPFQIAYLKTEKPIVTWTDSTFYLLNKFYPNYNNYHKSSVKIGNKTEAKALKRADLLVYCASWASHSAIIDYGISKEKIRILPFGANITPKQPIIDMSIDKKNVNLLFVGFDPNRKGLEKAISTTNILNSKGINATLTVIGPRSLDNFDLSHVNFLGQLDKNNPADLKTIEKAYEKAHFFLLPTKTEAYGIVFCEAMSNGLPCLSHDVGGTSDIIVNDRNGYKLDINSKPKDFADIILNYLAHPNDYIDLRKKTYMEYSERLNWHVSISLLIKEFKKILSANMIKQ